MTVGGAINLRLARFSGPVDLGDTSCYSIDASSVKWPAKRYDVVLTGLRYKEVHYGGGRAGLVNLVGRARYSGDAYSELEGYLRNQGYGEDADRVYIAGQERQRRELGWALNCWYLFYRFTLGYGRKGWNLLAYCAVVVVVGWWLFLKQERMVRTRDDGDTKPRRYRPLWYSIDLFLPVLGLGLASQWRPKGGCREWYWYLHRFMGWLLIPLLLMVIAGLVKQ
jgi:hypothetical protein